MTGGTAWRPDHRVLRGRARKQMRRQRYLMIVFLGLLAAAPLAPLVIHARSTLVLTWWGLAGLAVLLVAFQLLQLRRLVTHRRASTPIEPRSVETEGPIDFDKVWSERRGSD